MNPELWLPDSELEPAHAEFVGAVRAFAASKLLPHAREVDEQRQFRRQMVADLAQAGILGGPLPREHGGQAWSPLQLALAHEELGAHCGNARGFCAVQTGLVAQCIAKNGTKAQQQRFLPDLIDGSAIGCFALTEPEAGSDPAAMRTTAVKKGDRYVLNGEKIFITNAGVAQVFTVMAITDKSKGIKGISAFVLERGFPGLTVGKNELKMGMHGSTTCPLAFKDCEVPAENLLGAEGMGYVQALKTLTAGRVTIAARSCAIMDRLIERCIEYMKTRSQGGRKIAEYQGLQWMLADMAVARDAARLLTDRALEALLRGERATLEASVAKLHATEALAKVADCAVQIHGGMGYMREAGIETVYRDVRIVRIYEGTSEIQRNIIAGQLLKE